MKALFLSDAHLGAGADSIDRERQLCQLIENHRDNLDQVFLMGDMFDFWFTYRRVVPRGHTRLLGKLAELHDKGVEIHYFIGNHDMWLFDYLHEEIGAIMHPEPHAMTIQGRRVLLGHGDGLGHLDRSYDFIKFFFRNPICQWLFSILPSRFSFWIATSWSRSSRKSHPEEEYQYLGDDREGIVLYCQQKLEEEQFDYCVFGHRHTPLVRCITSPSGRTTTYLNVGDFLHHRSYAIMVDGELKLVEE